MGAAKSLRSPFDQPELPEGTLCFASGKPAKKWMYWGRSYLSLREKILTQEYSQNMAKVDPYGCWHGTVDGVAGDEELDYILGSALDFLVKNLEGDEFAGDWDASKSQYLRPILMDVLIGPPTIVQSEIDA